MKKLKLLPALAVIGGLGLSACKPAADRTQERVSTLITSVAPDTDTIGEAQEYYNGRTDLSSITPEQRQSLVYGCAKLRRLEDGLRKGTVSLQDFIQLVLDSDAQIITDEHTKLKISHNIGRPVGSISFRDKEWKIWTDEKSPNRLLKNPKISSITLNGGTLQVDVTGEEYDLQSPDSKYDVLADIEGEEVLAGERTYTFTTGLVLSSQPSVVARK